MIAYSLPRNFLSQACSHNTRVAHKDGVVVCGEDDVDDNDDDVKDLEPPGGVKRLVAGEAAETVSVIVTACRDHLLSREYLPRIAWKIGIVFHHHLDDDEDEDDDVARNGSFYDPQ